jgi:hypothetical protein
MEEPGFRDSVETLARSLAARDDDATRPRVSTAEFLDLVQVLRKSGLSTDDALWRTVEGLVLLHPRGES